MNIGNTGNALDTAARVLNEAGYSTDKITLAVKRISSTKKCCPKDAMIYLLSVEASRLLKYTDSVVTEVKEAVDSSRSA